MEQERALREAIAALERRIPELGEAAVAAATAPLEAQLDALRGDGWHAQQQRLRLVTVLFCDVVGSTTMARQLDPEDVHAVMDSSLATLSEVVERHGGRVLQYAGDSILAVFGADVSKEEDPRFAVRAGLDMLVSAQQLAARVETTHGVAGFDIRVGIHSGRVLLGAGVDRHNSIRGMPVNVAARMEQSAPAGALRVSHAVYRLVRGIFDVVAQPPIKVKGLDQPVRSYLVLSERDDAVRTVTRGVDGVEVRFIGRDAELRSLQQALRALDAGGGPAAMLVLVSGEAGMGKSRLVDEFEVWGATREPGCVIRQGRALPQTRHQPYGLLRDLFFRWARIRASDSTVQARDAFLHTYGELLGAPADEDLLLLARVIGLDAAQELAATIGDGRIVRERAYRCATRCVQRLLDTAGRPVVMILDDLHWADDDSLAWLQQLLACAADRPLLVLATTRPELLQRDGGWPGESVSSEIMPLRPLSKRACAGLVNELLQRLDQVPDELRDRLVAAADGNPFYLEERVKILLDDGAVVSDGEAWRLVPDRLSTTRLPDTLTGVLQARLDRLSRAERRALRQAAIVGFLFWDEALAAIDEAAPTQLEALERRELIVRQADSTLDGAREYAFHHHTLHQVARDGVLKTDRAHYHLSVGDWMERRTAQRPGEFHGRIAYHFERGQAPERALHHYVLGAEAAAARHSRDAVFRHVEAALELAPDSASDSRWRLLIAREAMLATTDDRAAHDDDLRALAQLAECTGDKGKRALATWRQAMAHISAGRYPDGLAVADAAARLAERAGDTATAAGIAGTRATALRRLNDFAQARQVAEDGLVQARASGSAVAEKELLYSVAALAAETGRLEEASRLGQEYLELATASGDQSAEAIGENLIGDSLYRLGDLASARSHLERSLALSRRLAHAYGECIAALNLALVANGQGRYDDAMASASLATEIAVRGGTGDLEAVALLQLGIAQGGCGEADRARETLRAAGERYVANGSAHLCVETDSALARVALGAGDLDEALRRVESVLAHIEDGGSLDGTEDPLRIRWDCYSVLAAGQDTRADAWLAESWAQLRERARQIDDPTRRSAFLTCTRHHAALTRAWQRRV